ERRPYRCQARAEQARSEHGGPDPPLPRAARLHGNGWGERGGVERGGALARAGVRRAPPPRGGFGCTRGLTVGGRFLTAGLALRCGWWCGVFTHWLSLSSVLPTVHNGKLGSGRNVPGRFLGISRDRRQLHLHDAPTLDPRRECLGQPRRIGDFSILITVRGRDVFHHQRHGGCKIAVEGRRVAFLTVFEVREDASTAVVEHDDLELRGAFTGPQCERP